MIELPLAHERDVRSCEGLRMPVPRRWRGAHGGPAYANSKGGNRGRGHVGGEAWAMGCELAPKWDPGYVRANLLI
jgi:hypothetical protein